MAHFVHCPGADEGFLVTDGSFSPGERRHHRRRPLSLPMALEVNGTRVLVTALDVSVGGVAVRTTAIAEVGARVALEAELGGERAVAFEAEVVRFDRGVLGLRFRELGQRELEALLAALGRLASVRDDTGSAPYVVEGPSGGL